MHDEKSILYYLFQLKEESDKARELRFMSMKDLNQSGQTIDGKNYSLVYQGKLNPENQSTGEILESLYELFNLYHPDDFRGHSLSVSDVIVLRKDGRDQAYYVDAFGFKQVPEFLAADPLHKVEELLEDDYGMIDGLINNGEKKEEKEENEKQSVLEKLQKKRDEVSQMEQHQNLLEKENVQERNLN